mgnify:CR=1 FL=1
MDGKYIQNPSPKFRIKKTKAGTYHLTTIFSRSQLKELRDEINRQLTKDGRGVRSDESETPT